MRLRLHWLIAFCLSLPACPGCAVFERTRPVPVLVRDAETKKPIPGAEVTISYPLTKGWGAPTRSSGITDSTGIVRLNAVPAPDLSIVMDAGAPDYLTEWQPVPVDDVRRLDPVPYFGKADDRAVRYVVELYAAPEATIEFVLPEGMHGTFKALIQGKDDAPVTVGQRLFVGQVSAEGEVTIVGPPLLRHLNALKYQAKYDDGSPIKTRSKGLETGLWWLKSEGPYQYFFVGTELDYRIVSQNTEHIEQTSHRPSGGGGRGHGRRGH